MLPFRVQARYSQNHQWASYPNGTISFEDGHIIGNAKFTREVINRYAIQEGFTLKKIKNDRYMYTVTCKNDACDWRLHASCLTNKVTFMIMSVRGSHSMCPRVAENKEATSRWVASVLGNFIHSNPNGKAKLFKNELQERFAVKVDNQTIYRANKIVLETLKSDHVEAYAKLRKCGNAIRSYNSGTYVMVAMNPDVKSDNPTFLIFYMSFKACELEPVEKWARHAFEPSLKVDHVSNNISECFNSCIREDRDKPKLQLLENFRRKIMVRFCEKWAKAEKLNDTITPYAKDNLNMNEKEARKLQVIYENDEAWKMAYDGNINPILDESKWPEFESQNIEPPVKKMNMGRPKKKRTRAPAKPRAPNATFSKRFHYVENLDTIGQPVHLR
ncbi:hypothetical protein EZV62_010647 [Acer yangbiense]|uniref:Transposase MuDR plant domain-containing protein n=1 Tax=Acer yangbiense TaxID=1000413 RepID=A0A5C7I2B9_9ROSI|nr:hypothetical protein EZV62_010647 [Acer yangbiense]